MADSGLLRPDQDVQRFRPSSVFVGIRAFPDGLDKGLCKSSGKLHMANVAEYRILHAIHQSEIGLPSAPSMIP